MDAAIRASKIAKIESHCILLTFLIVREGSGTSRVTGFNFCEHLAILAFDFLGSGFFSHFLVPFLSMAIYTPDRPRCQDYNFVMFLMPCFY
jgi:hypothetical protein